jgi:hypothetical protein
MWQSLLASAFACLVLVAACELPLRDETGMRRCRAGDLVGVWGGENGLTGGQILGSVLLHDRAAEPCSLRGVPDVSVVFNSGAVVRAAGCTPRPSSWFSCDSEQRVVLQPGPPPERDHDSLRKGDVALALFWRIHDGNGACITPPPGSAVALDVRLPDTGDVVRVSIESGDGTARAGHFLSLVTCGGGFTAYGFSGDR